MKGVIWLASGLMLSLLLLSGISVGSQMTILNSHPQNQSAKNISFNPNRAINQVDQLAAVSSTWETVSLWLDPFFSWLNNLWNRFLNIWKNFLGLSPNEPPAPTITSAMREQIRQELLVELRAQGLLDSNILSNEVGGTKYGIMVAPSTGSTTRDEWLKKSLGQMFADQVNLKFDRTGMSGLVTPTFRDGRQGGDYVFVLTPIK